MQVVVNSLLTSYSRSGVSTGGKPEIVILHGWGDSAAGWQVLQAELTKDYTITVLDLPGFGGTDRPSSAWGLTDYANFVTAFLKKMNLLQRIFTLYIFQVHPHNKL